MLLQQGKVCAVCQEGFASCRRGRLGGRQRRQAAQCHVAGVEGVKHGVGASKVLAACGGKRGHKGANSSGRVWLQYTADMVLPALCAPQQRSRHHGCGGGGRQPPNGRYAGRAALRGAARTGVAALGDGAGHARGLGGLQPDAAVLDDDAPGGGHCRTWRAGGARSKEHTPVYHRPRQRACSTLHPPPHPPTPQQGSGRANHRAGLTPSSLAASR